jgi:hypothetical protein
MRTSSASSGPAAHGKLPTWTGPAFRPPHTMINRRQLVCATCASPLCALLAACEGSDSKEDASMASSIATADHLRALSTKRIFFGHQSVGGNVMEGVQDLVQAHAGTGLRVIESLAAATYAAPVFGHAHIGINEQPLTKIEGFADVVGKQLQGAVDIAFFKFCYIDFKPDTDVSALFVNYEVALARLHQRFPKTVFAHVTVPITTAPSALKRKVKGWLGREDTRLQANIQRERFNDLLRKGVQGQPLFDLAQWESTSEAGERHLIESQGPHAALIDGYSDDGNHLNPRGRRWVASKLLAFLANLPSAAA